MKRKKAKQEKEIMKKLREKIQRDKEMWFPFSVLRWTYIRMTILF